MFANIPTWTTERVELLKSHFEAGLSCRQIAAHIGFRQVTYGRR